MIKLQHHFKLMALAMTLLLGGLITGCKGGGEGSRAPILGADGVAVLAPYVTAVTPLNNATAVRVDNPIITATFNQPMAPLSGGATFTVTSVAPGITPTGTVTLNAANTTATFTPAVALSPLTLYTATVTGARSLATGLPMASPYVWTFTTGARPRVTSTVPATTVPGPTLGVAANTAVTATFTTAMAPATLTATSFTLTGPGAAAVSGAVSYSGLTAVFTPSAQLLFSTTYTATVTTAATDVAGNALAGNQAALPAASNYVWTFTTAPPPDVTRPRVAITVPATTIPGPTVAIPINTAITAAFTEAMAPATINAASFLLTGPGVLPVAGTVTYSGVTAVFTPAALLVANTTYTATITTAATDLAGNALAGNQAPLPAASNYVWTFTTSPAPDTTRPRVVLTVPVTTTPGPTLSVPLNTAITATFTEDMQPATLNALSFTVVATAPGVSPVGSVTYNIASRTAVFTPTLPLTANTTYTATVTTAATDLAGNALAGNQAPLPGASNYVWTFVVAAVDVLPPQITLTTPANGAINVANNAAVNATFSEAMDPLTINALNFTVRTSGLPLGPILPGVVTYNPLTFVATFTPTGLYADSTQYTATVTGAKDVAGNLLIPGLVPNPWVFTTGAAIVPPGPINLGSAGAYGIMATAAITNTGFTTINGDVSLSPGTSMTGFPPGIVNGGIHINDLVSAQARADLLVAFNQAKALPPGVTIAAGADLGALYPLGIPPGTYTSGSTMLVSTPLVLDAGGNANAIWVFQIGSSLTTTASVSLLNGAQAKNVFWVPTLDGTIGVGTVFYGTILAGRDVTAKTGTVVFGRILAGATNAGTIALDTNTVNVPAP